MNTLEQKEYLRQPHTSAGRIPTGKAYRFFVDNCIQKHFVPESLKRRLRNIRQWHTLLQTISEATQLLTIATYGDPPTILYFGMGGVLEAPEFNDPYLTRKLGYLMDSFLYNRTAYQTYTSNRTAYPLVFIEEENPLPEAQFASIVSRSVNNGTILTIGPTRMNYEATVAILRAL